MGILVDLYDSRSLTAAVNKIKVTDPFVYEAFFKGNKQDHDSELIDFETRYGNEKIAQVVHRDDTVPRIVEKNVKKVQQLALTRTFEAKIFTARELAELNVVGNIYGSFEARRAAQKDKVREELEELRERVIRLREKMSCDGIATGKIAIRQPNIEVDVDFLFENGKQLITLTGANLWSHADSSPTEKLIELRRMIVKASTVSPKYLIFGTEAAKAFRLHKEVKGNLDTNNLKVGQFDLNAEYKGSAWHFGNYSGFYCIEYMQTYVNSSKAVTDMIPPDRAILVAPSKDFRTHFGPAWRIQNNNSTSEPVFGEFIIEIDQKSNSQMLQWNCEQKSLPSIHDPGCVISVKVV